MLAKTRTNSISQTTSPSQHATWGSSRLGGAEPGRALGHHLAVTVVAAAAAAPAGEE